MIELQLPKFGLPKYFQYLEKKMANFKTSDLKYENNKNITTMEQGQVNKYTRTNIKVDYRLECLNLKINKYM
jgi:hypothetical protein